MKDHQVIKWTRKCQECFHIQSAQQPEPATLTNSYANAKCRKCKSEALDYGQERIWDPTNQIWVKA